MKADSSFVRFGIAVVCPIALALAFPKTNATPLALVALAPLFWLWATSSWKAALGWGLLSGTLLFLLLDGWMIYSLGDEVGNARFAALILLSVGESMFIAIVAVAIALLARGRLRASMVFAAPAAWLLVESARTNGTVSMPFAQLGAVAAHAAWLLPMAAYAGMYGLTAIVALANGAVAGVFFGDRSARIAGAAVLAALVALVAVGDALRAPIAVPLPNTKVAIVQGAISQRQKWTPAIFTHTMEVYAGLTRRAAGAGARIVVWPETAITDFPLEKADLLAALQALTRSQNIWLVAGTVSSPQRGSLYNVVMTLDPRGVVGDVYRKYILVPFAEFLPFERLFRGMPGFNRASAFHPGSGAGTLDVDGQRFGALICFESAYSSYARADVLLGSSALLIVTDDAWFGPTNGPIIHADLAAIDAVETGSWIVRGADTGISQIIDPKGRIVSALPLDRQDFILASVGPRIETPYVRFGATWLLMLAALALIAAALWSGRSVTHSASSGAHP